MTDELDDQVRMALQRRRRRPMVPIVVIMFGIIASACAYLWVNYGDQVRTAVFATSPATASKVASDQEPVSRPDFDAFERQTADSLQSAAENLEAQKADLKRLADEVAALSAKVDALQSATSSISAQTSVAPAVPPRPATIVPRRKPPASKSTGPISVGGAPLPASSNQ